MGTADTPVAGTVLLAGIVGSTAYGLARPGSDIDRLGVFAAPTVAFHGLQAPEESHVTTKPDRTVHEAAKFCRLALTGNPTVSELLWLPDDLYETRTRLGDELIGIRTAFLSAKRVRDAYLGYATQQFRRLAGRGDGSFSADTRKRTAKHARHLMRLCEQGLGLYRTGRLEIRLTDPDRFHEFGERVAAGDLALAENLVIEYEQRFDEVRTPLPEQPDEPTVESWLRSVRAADPSGVATDTTGQAADTSGLRTGRRHARPIVLCDVDGTVALMGKGEPGRRRFFDYHRVGEDDPHQPVIELVQVLRAAGYPIVFMSGREDVCRDETMEWLLRHGVAEPGDELYMRARHDGRGDDVVKRELYRRHIKARGRQVAWVIDDRDRVVRMWRDLGLTVLQVADGNF